MAKTGTPLERAYYAQKQAAKQRGVSWELTFAEWLYVWEDSGHLSERGKGCGKYCMARHRDTGPYHVSNVSIIPYEKNSGDRIVGKEERSKRQRRMIGNNLGALNIGLVWITNGVNSHRVSPTVSIPVGWRRGYTRQKQGAIGSIWITNDVNSKRIKPFELIPEGWRKGFTQKHHQHRDA